MVFLDESGILMAPILRRTWAPRCHTPVFSQRTRSHRKISVIAALTVAPDGIWASLYFRLHPDINIGNHQVTAFLRQLLRQIPGPLVVIWDRFGPHRCGRTKKFLAASPRIHAYHFPPYAPELNPVEGVWGYLKTNPLANWPARELPMLTTATRRYSRSLQRQQHLLWSFINHTHLLRSDDTALFM